MKDDKKLQAPDRLLGREDKPEAGDIITDPDSFAGKLSNFWYYEKWKVIIAVAAVIVFVICCFQMCENADTDLTVMYAGSCYKSKAEVTEIEKILSGFMPGNADGEKKAALCQLHIYSDKQTEDRIKELGKDSVNIKANQDELKSYDNLILAGEYSIVIAEPWLYERVAKSGGFRKLSDVLGKVPENAADEYSVRLRDTALYRAKPELFADYTEDTVIALRTESVLAKKTSAAVYNRSCALFIELIKP
ncbi:MAG: hypothetical protein MJ137_06790 [Clostridia bacterium]|nr:hypothetical protein [Clostridia bacterium]